jgi:hypothetical protein
MQERQLDMQKKELELKRTQTLYEALDKAAKGTPTDPGTQSANPLEKMDAQASELQRQADIYMSAGMPEEAAKLADQARKLVNTRSTIIDHETTAQTNKLTQAVKKNELAGQLLGGVTDENSWKAAARQFAQMTGDDSYVNMPYNPQVVDSLKQKAMTAWQAAQLKIRTITAQAQIANVSSEIKSRNFRDGLAKTKEERAEERDTARQKAQGLKPADAPSAKERDAAAAEIKAAVPGLDSNESARTVNYVVGAAKQIVRDAPGVSFAEALTRATQQYIKSGELTVGKAGKDGSIESGSAHFKPGMAPGTGNNPTAPLSFAQIATAKDGQYISTPKGVVRYNAKTKDYTLVDGGSGAPMGGDEDDDDDEDEE